MNSNRVVTIIPADSAAVQPSDTVSSSTLLITLSTQRAATSTTQEFKTPSQQPTQSTGRQRIIWFLGSLLLLAASGGAAYGTYRAKLFDDATRSQMTDEQKSEADHNIEKGDMLTPVVGIMSVCFLACCIFAIYQALAPDESEVKTPNLDNLLPAAPYRVSREIVELAAANATFASPHSEEAKDEEELNFEPAARPTL